MENAAGKTANVQVVVAAIKPVLAVWKPALPMPSAGKRL